MTSAEIHSYSFSSGLEPWKTPDWNGIEAVLFLDHDGIDQCV